MILLEKITCIPEPPQSSTSGRACTQGLAEVAVAAEFAVVAVAGTAVATVAAAVELEAAAASDGLVAGVVPSAEAATAEAVFAAAAVAAVEAEPEQAGSGEQGDTACSRPCPVGWRSSWPSLPHGIGFLSLAG